MNKKRLYRSRDEKMIGGVAGGLATYFDVEPTLVRLAFLVLLFANGIGLWVYIAAWIVMPEAPATGAEPKNVTPPKPVNAEQPQQSTEHKSEDIVEEIKAKVSNPDDPDHSRSLFGLILIGVGALFLLRPYFDWLDIGQLWPLILVAIGAAILLRR